MHADESRVYTTPSSPDFERDNPGWTSITPGPRVDAVPGWSANGSYYAPPRPAPGAYDQLQRDAHYAAPISAGDRAPAYSGLPATGSYSASPHPAVGACGQQQRQARYAQSRRSANLPVTSPPVADARTPTGSALPPSAAEDHRSRKIPPSKRPRTVRSRMPKLSANVELVKRLRKMNDADYMLWRNKQNLSWSEVAEEDLPILCRTCRMYDIKNMSSGSTVYDHISSARHVESIARTRNQFANTQFPQFVVPASSRELEQDEFQVLETRGRSKPAEKERQREKERYAILGMLRYIQSPLGNKSFGAWVARSLANVETSDVRKKEAVAREVTVELSKLFHYEEEDTRDYSVQKPASGNEYLYDYTLDVEFPTL